MHLRFYLTTSLLCAALSSAFAQLPFTLTAQLPKGMNGQKVYLVVYGDYTDHIIEKKFTAVVQNDQFTIRGAINKPLELAVLNIFNQDDRLSGHTTVALEAKNNRLVVPDNTAVKNILADAVITDSKANEINHIIDLIEHPAKGPNIDSDKGYRDIEKQEINTLAAYSNEYYSLLKLYVIASKNDIINEAEDLPLSVFKTFSPALQSSELGKIFLEETTATRNSVRLSSPGSQVPQFTVLDDRGKLFNTASLKGSPYIIGFSATWCVPCQAHQPALLALYHKYRSKGLKIVYFNMDNDVAKWQNLIKNKKLDWINVSERTPVSYSKIAKQFNVHSYPDYILVDKTGKIVCNIKDMDDARLEEYTKQVL